MPEGSAGNSKPRGGFGMPEGSVGNSKPEGGFGMPERGPAYASTSYSVHTCSFQPRTTSAKRINMD